VRRSTFFFLAWIVGGAATAAQPPATPLSHPEPELYEVTFPVVSIPKGARILGFSIEVRGGWVVSISAIPKNWSVSLSMDPPCCPRVSGGGHHGADALTEGEHLQIKVVVERWWFPDAPTLSASGVLQATPESEASKSGAVPVSKMVITRVSGRAPR